MPAVSAQLTFFQLRPSSFALEMAVSPLHKKLSDYLSKTDLLLTWFGLLTHSSSLLQFWAPTHISPPQPSHIGKTTFPLQFPEPWLQHCLVFSATNSHWFFRPLWAQKHVPTFALSWNWWRFEFGFINILSKHKNSEFLVYFDDQALSWVVSVWSGIAKELDDVVKLKFRLVVWELSGT